METNQRCALSKFTLYAVICKIRFGYLQQPEINWKIIYQLDKTGFSQVFSDDGSLPVFKGLLLGMVEEFPFGALQKDFLYPTRS